MNGMDVAGLLMMILVGWLVSTLVSVFYIRTLYLALSRCAPESRAMSPGMVWLLLVPFWNLVWNFIVVARMTASLRAEFGRRGGAPIVDFGRELGLAMSILYCLSIIPFVGLLCSIAGVVCWILYWVKIADLSGRLAHLGPPEPAAA